MLAAVPLRGDSACMNFKRVALVAVSLCAFIAFAITTKRVVLANEHIFEGLVTFKTTVTHQGAVTNSAAVTNSSTVLNSGAVTNSSTVTTTGLETLHGGLKVNGTTYLDGGTTVNGDLFVDGGLTVGGAIAQKVVVGHLQQDGGRPALGIESGVVTLSGGTATFTFAEAFSYAPLCVCNDTATTAAAASCSGASTTQVVPKGGATATISFICVGPR